MILRRAFYRPCDIFARQHRPWGPLASSPTVFLIRLSSPWLLTLVPAFRAHRDGSAYAGKDAGGPRGGVGLSVMLLGPLARQRK